MIDEGLFKKIGLGGLEQLAKRQTTDADVQFKLGLARADAGNLEGAVDAWIEAVRLDQNGELPVVHYLGQAYLDLGKYNLATTLLIQSLERDPAGPFAAQAYLLLGQAYEGLRDPNCAHEAYQKALQLNDLSIPAQEGLSRTDLLSDCSIATSSQPELIFNGVLEFKNFGHGTTTVRLRIFRHPQTVVVCTYSEGSQSVTNFVQYSAGPALMTDHGINLKEATWIDCSAGFCGSGPLYTLINLSLDHTGQISGYTFSPVHRDRVRELTGLGLD